MGEASACLNCGTGLEGEYCHRCGQRDLDLDRSLHEVLGEMAGEAFEADGRLLATLKPFFLAPGELVHDWIEGRRARYTSPARIFVFALFVGFVGVSVAADHSVARVSDDALPEAVDGEVHVGSDDDVGTLDIRLGGDDSDLRREFGSQRKLAEALVGGMVDEGPKVVFALVPALALYLQLLLWRERFLTHLVFSLHQHSRLLILGGLALLLPFDGPLGIVLLIGQVYAVLGLRRAYGLSWRGALWRYAVLLLVYVASAMAGLMALAIYAATLSLGLGPP